MDIMKFIRKILMMIVVFQGVLQCSQDKWTPPAIPENIKNLEKFLKEKYKGQYNNMRKFYNRYYERIIRSMQKNDVFVDYTFDFSPALEEIKKGTFFCNIFKRHCEQFFNNIIIPENEQIKKDLQTFLAQIAALAQDSPKCWMVLLNKVENMVKSLPVKQAQSRFEILKEHLYDFFRKKVQKVSAENENTTREKIKFLFDVLGDSAVRAYAYLQSKNENFSDFYILAVLNAYKNYDEAGYENFKRDLLEKLNTYLKELKVSDDKIAEISKKVGEKAEYSYVRRNWKYILGGVVALGVVGGLGYLLYKNKKSSKELENKRFEGQSPEFFQENLINEKILPDTINLLEDTKKNFFKPISSRFC